MKKDEGKMAIYMSYIAGCQFHKVNDYTFLRILVKLYFFKYHFLLILKLLLEKNQSIS